MITDEEYQKNIEKCYKEKFLSRTAGYSYQGDIVTKLLYGIISKFVKSGYILDVGAGTGALVKFLKTKGYENVCGIDLYPKVDFIEKGEITRLEFRDAHFSTVFCTEVIEHLQIEQIIKGLKEIHRVLNKGGYLIITVPCDENLERDAVVCPICQHKFHIVGHLQSFSKKIISELLTQNNFVIQFMKVFPLPIMAKLPLSNFYWRFLMLLDKRVNFYKNFVIVAKKE